MTVAPCLIVERVDVVSDIGCRSFSVFVDALSYSFLLQAAEEGLCNRVIPAVSPPAHARFKMIRAAKALPVIASILRALVRVNESVPGTTLAHRHHDGVEDEIAGDRWL